MSLWQRALEVMPGGVNSPVRAFKSVGGEPVFMERASGAQLFDRNGKAYVDYVGSWGPAILGHGHPEVLDVVRQQMEMGMAFGTATELEVLFAEYLCQRVPSLEMVRLVNSGTEATLAAIRVARGFTGRNAIVKFRGCYHGHGDAFLIEAGSGAMTHGVPSSAGVSAAVAQDTLIADYNDLASVEKLFSQNEIAAVILEPVVGNMGVLIPDMAFLQGLRDLCDRHQTVLIFDEVMTGFRLSPTGAQGLYGIQPDLSTFGKIIGGGLPVGAYGGKKEIMQMVSPSGPVYQAGTLSGHPWAVRAGWKTLELLGSEQYDRLESLGNRLEQGLRQAISETGVTANVNRVGSMLTLFFTASKVNGYADAAAANTQQFAKFFNLMLEQGFYLPPSQFEAWFISLAHSEEQIDQTIQAAKLALRSL